MATYYFEGQPILAPFTIESRKVVLSSETASQRVFTRATDGQRWDLSFRVATNNPQDLFIAMLDNDVVVNTMVMPQIKNVDDLLKPITTYPYTIGAHAAGLSAITTWMDNLGTFENNTKVIAKGSFIQFSNHTKIYTVTSDVVEGSIRTINIFPKLQSAVPNATTIKLPNTPVKPTLSYTRDVANLSGITYSDGIMVDVGTITIKEKI